MCSLSKEQSILSREIVTNAFYSEYGLFRLGLFILYQAPRNRAFAPAYGLLVFHTFQWYGLILNATPRCSEGPVTSYPHNILFKPLAANTHNQSALREYV